jgi:periplasmic copper chaperone A
MRARSLRLGLSLLCCLFSLGVVAQTAEVQVTEAWARATPGGAQTAAVYATLQSAAGDELTGISTPVAKEAQLHEMSMEGGVMKMRQVEQLDLPPGQSVTLKPGGYHVMLVGLSHPLVEGQTFPLTLTFAKAGMKDVTVGVQKVGAMGPGNSSSMPGMKMPSNH